MKRKIRVSLTPNCNTFSIKILCKKKIKNRFIVKNGERNPINMCEKNCLEKSKLNVKNYKFGVKNSASKFLTNSFYHQTK